MGRIKAYSRCVMKFKEIEPGVLFFDAKPGTVPTGSLFYKIPEPRVSPLGKCDGCGERRVWNARNVRGDFLVHFCPNVEITPADVKPA